MKLKLKIIGSWFKRLKWYEYFTELPQILYGLILVIFHKCRYSDHIVRKNLLVIYTNKNVKDFPIVLANLVLINQIGELRYSKDYVGPWMASRFTGWVYLFFYYFPSRAKLNYYYKENGLDHIYSYNACRIKKVLDYFAELECFI